MQKNRYTKHCTRPEDLIPLLRNRGLQIDNETTAQTYLLNIGYFRLSAYFYPLLSEPKSKHVDKPGATFTQAINMYRFDRKLRLLLFNEIEKIKVAFRSALVNLVSHHLNDIFWITNKQYFKNQRYFVGTKALNDAELRKSREDLYPLQSEL